ncbi:MAG: O-antigen ligase family protein [Alcanivoracaceae bacterium]|nr:O-antigen ligase family protein [Alcanivoracaceae bacterium]
MSINIMLNRSTAVLICYLSVMVLLPFSRLAELPLLFLTIIGIYGLFTQWQPLKSSKRFRVLSWVFACYFFLIIISAVDSYWQAKTFMVALASLRFYLATIALILYLPPKYFMLLLKVIAILAIFWALDAMFQYFVGVDIVGRSSYEGRLNGIFGEHHVKLGPVLALLLPVVMIVLQKQNAIIRWLSIVLLIVTIILSGTRSAWIMMVFILLTYWYHHVKQRRFQLLMKASVIAIVIIASLWLISPEFQQRIDRSMKIFDGSEAGIDFALADRLSIWQTSLRMIEQHPINGIGAHAFRKAYPQFAGDDDIWQQQGGVGMHAHHWILEILAETGLMGLIFMSFAIFKLFIFVRNNYNNFYSWAFSVMLVSAFLPITSTYSLFASFWSICIWFCGAGLIVTSSKELVGKQDD